MTCFRGLSQVGGLGVFADALGKPYGCGCSFPLFPQRSVEGKASGEHGPLGLATWPGAGSSSVWLLPSGPSPSAKPTAYSL